MRMSFKASMPDPRILIIQIVVVAVLASVFRNLLALFLLVLIVDFLLLLQCGWAVFWKKPSVLCSYAADTVCAARDIHSDCFGFVSAFPFVDGEAISGVFGSEGSD